jgi:hypothetical protein
MEYYAFPVEIHPVSRQDAQRSRTLNTRIVDGRHDLRLQNDTAASAVEVIGRALEDTHVPTGTTKRRCGEKTSKRAPDYESPRFDLTVHGFPLT